MNNLLNPFRVIAGTRALLLGLVFIVATALLEWSGGVLQDGYLHYTLMHKPLWQVLLVDVISWLLPAVLLYACGVAMSRSKVRIIDMLGTTAFARILVLPMVLPLLIPSMQELMMELITNPLGVATMPESQMLMLGAMGLVTTLFLVLFFICNYNAFSVSCNVRGAKAIVIYIAIQFFCTILGVLLFRLLM